jgi:hypothetical protein
MIMSLQKRLNKLHEEIITALCSVEEFPDGLLPHTVYVEEEGENSMSIGNSVFNPYSLIRIFPDGSCLLENPQTGKEEKRELNEINIDWLVVVWDYYRDLANVKEPEPVKKIKYVFLYSIDNYNRDASNKEILSGWENDNDVEKLTPDEFAERINDEMFADLEYWVRFIEVED